MIKQILSIAAISLTLLHGQAQSVVDQFRDNPCKSGGVYYAYPGPEDPSPTAPPEGYSPFYISHYGRHGSRYLLSDRDYTKVIDMLQAADSANALTPLGKEILANLKEIWKEAEGHTDELSPLGKRQHAGIAERMFRNYPEVFADSARLSSRSTTSLRCCLSMVAFITRLKELNPALRIDWDTSKSDMMYMNYHSEEYETTKNGPEGYAKTKLGELNMQAIQAAPKIEQGRFVNELISNPTYFKNPMEGRMLMQGIFDIASDLQDMETTISLYPLFTAEELYSCWIGSNIWFYTSDANSPHNKGTAIASCRNLLNNIIAGADKAIAGEGEAATLRFGHDGNIIPLAASLHLDGCDISVADGAQACELWQNYKVSPMAANIQLVFFRKNNSDDVIVKFLLNENETSIPIATDIAPFYHWADVRKFLIE